ncbi:MAG: DJ-1/PfpI family protein [Sediminibacterium sp.]
MKRKILKMIKRIALLLMAVVLVVVAVFSRAIQPVIYFTTMSDYKVERLPLYNFPAYDSTKKTVVIIADKDGTEMFDMMAPYYLFNTTGMANVYIVAEKFEPVIVRKGLLVMPQLTFRQVDSMRIPIDLIVVPNQSVHPGMKQKKATVNFVKTHYTGSNRILSVCDGSATVAASGIYDGKLLTTHSSDYETVKNQYKAPKWVQGLRVTKDGNLFSTAGVANATEGSLTVIRELFGDSVASRVMQDIHYPANNIITHHSSQSVTSDEIFIAIRKGAFKSNEKIGVLMKDGVNEFELAAILDTYTRSFPASNESYTIYDQPVISKYGLTILPTGVLAENVCTELHLPQGVSGSEAELTSFKDAKIVRYDAVSSAYVIDTCIIRITKLYGEKFANTVKLMLDYDALK